MTEKSTAMNNNFNGDSTKCDCSEGHTDDESFTIVCSMEGTHDDGSDDTFVHSEHMVLELNQGKYNLKETSWSYHDSEVSYDSQEVFHLTNGIVTSCEAKECASCSVCDDQKSIAVDCSNLSGYIIECSERYTGPFSHSFDFGTITLPEVDGHIHNQCNNSNSCYSDETCQSPLITEHESLSRTQATSKP